MLMRRSSSTGAPDTYRFTCLSVAKIGDQPLLSEWSGAHRSRRLLFSIPRSRSTTPRAIISILKSIFARHGIPEVISDNGPQYSSQEFADFATTYNLPHITTLSPVQWASGTDMDKHASDPRLALLSYRSTPLPWCGLSPAELLMGQKIRTNLPQREEGLLPKWILLQDFKSKNQEMNRRLTMTIVIALWNYQKSLMAPTCGSIPMAFVAFSKMSSCPRAFFLYYCLTRGSPFVAPTYCAHYVPPHPQPCVGSDTRRTSHAHHARAATP